MSTDCLHGLKDRKRKEKRRETKWKRKTNHLSFCVFGCRKKRPNKFGWTQRSGLVCLRNNSKFLFSICISTPQEIIHSFPKDHIMSA